MTLPFSVPDWLPWWAVIIVLVPILLWLLAFLVMPFNVFGLRGRLEMIEARLDEMEGELRALAARRAPEAAQVARPAATRAVPAAPSPARPPPGRWRETEEDAPEDLELPEEPQEELPRPRALRPRPGDDDRRPPPSRTEPRLDWPR